MVMGVGLDYNKPAVAAMHKSAPFILVYTPTISEPYYLFYFTLL